MVNRGETHRVDAWKGGGFSGCCAACKCDQRFQENGVRLDHVPAALPPSLVPKCLVWKIILTAAACIRPHPQVWWLAFLWLRPSSTAAKETLWFQCAPRSPSHAGKCVRPLSVTLSLSPASISSLVPDNFESCWVTWAAMFKLNLNRNQSLNKTAQMQCHSMWVDGTIFYVLNYFLLFFGIKATPPALYSGQRFICLHLAQEMSKMQGRGIILFLFFFVFLTQHACAASRREISLLSKLLCNFRIHT